MAAPDGWEDYVRRWAGQLPPLRPHPDSVIAMAKLLEKQAGTTLLLGVTPELASLSTPTIAVDWAESAIRDIWPGDTEDRHALLGDWRALPLSDVSVGSVIGDGSLNAVRWPHGAHEVACEIDRVLMDDGIIVCRAFVAPDTCEAISVIADEIRTRREPSFAAAKWRMAMALTDADGNVAVADIHAAFEDQFPDREQLAQQTGWPLATIAEIDAYRGSAMQLAFPTGAMFERVAAPRFRARWVAAGSYPLASRCPVLMLYR